MFDPLREHLEHELFTRHDYHHEAFGDTALGASEAMGDWHPSDEGLIEANPDHPTLQLGPPRPGDLPF